MKSSRIEIKEGNSVIPIYKFSDGRFCVDAVIAGKRKRITRFSLDAAKLEARRILALDAKGRDSEEPLPNAEAEDYRMAKHKLAPYNISLHSVVEDWISLHLRSKNVIPKSVPEAVNEFLVAKQVEGVSPLHLSDRQSRLRKFAISFRGRVDRVTENEVEEWLSQIKGSRRTRRNYRDAILQLFRFARSKRFLPKGEPTGIDEVTVTADREGKIGIYSPDEMRTLLMHTPQRLLPYFALGAFAGLRSQEIMRLEWSDIKFNQQIIEVSAANSKTASRRLVPLLPTLTEWLSPHKKESGRVMEYAHNAALGRARIKFCESGIRKGSKTIKFKWKSNALRHSYASYRLADVKDAARVALEMENSPSMLVRNCRELVTEPQAKEWFALTPDAVNAASGRFSVVA